MSEKVSWKSAWRPRPRPRRLVRGRGVLVLVDADEECLESHMQPASNARYKSVEPLRGERAGERKSCR